MQFAAPRISTSSSTESAAAATSAFRGMVTDIPARPRTLIASRASAPLPAGTSKAVNAQSMPAAANAALWMAGERE